MGCRRIRKKLEPKLQSLIPAFSLLAI